MPVKITGIMSHTRRSAEGVNVFDIGAINEYARAHEAAGFDRVLIANSTTMPDSFAIGLQVAHVTSRLGLMLAHRPGFIAPTMTARMLATIDRLSQGRAAVHIIPGASDLEMQADGDFLDKEQRYQRAAEYVELMRRSWSAEEPFDYDGEFYVIRGAKADVRPVADAIPVYWGGESSLAIALAGRWADVYALFNGPLDTVAPIVAEAHRAAAQAGRSIEVLMTMAVILGETPEAAWTRAQAICERMAASLPKTPPRQHPQLWKASKGFTRLMKLAEESEWPDPGYWTGITKIMGGRGNHNCLVGSVDQVATSLAAYYRCGVTRFLLRGFDGAADAERMGRELIPELHRRVAQIDRDGLTPAQRAGVATAVLSSI